MPDTIPRKLILQLIEKNFAPEATFSTDDLYTQVQTELQSKYPTIENIRHRVRAHLFHLTQAGMVVKTGPDTYTLSEEYPHHAEAPVPGTLYVLKDLQIGGYKIGISRTINDRLKTLKVGTKCDVVGLWDSPNYTDLERILHNMYKHCRIPQSEWFALKNDELYDLCDWLDDNASRKKRNLEPKPTPKVEKNNSGTVIIIICMLYLTGCMIYVNSRIDSIVPTAVPVAPLELVD